MSTKVMLYAHQSLAACGFVVLDNVVAATLRPDLWISGIECLGDFSLRDTKNKLGSITGVQQLTAMLAGSDRQVLVLTRSTDQLAQRIEWVTGFKAVQIEEEAKAPTAKKEFVAMRSINSVRCIAFKERPRPCTECGNLNSAGCVAVMRGEIPAQPNSINIPRHCLAYIPSYYLTSGDHRDYRTGKELWPDLLVKEQEPEVAQLEHSGAMDKAMAMLDDTLKGGARAAAEILERAESAGMSERTVQRAADMLGVVKSKSGFNGGWVWALHYDQ